MATGTTGMLTLRERLESVLSYSEDTATSVSTSAGLNG